MMTLSVRSVAAVCFIIMGSGLFQAQAQAQTNSPTNIEKEQIKAKIQTDAPFAHPLVLTKLLNRAAYDFPIKKLTSLLDPNNTIGAGI
jgi:hypothetical protein